MDFALFPIDSLKTRIQSKEKLTVVKNQSFKIYYSGVKSIMLSSFPSAAAFFATYDTVKFLLLNSNIVLTLEPFFNQNTTLAFMISASLAECSAVLVRNPFELIKQNMQIGRYNSFGEAVKTIYLNKGFKGFMTGYLITVMREIPFSIIQFPIFEYYKSKLNDRQKDNVLLIGLCGAKAGAIAGVLTNPLDVIKTRIMTDASQDSSIGHRVIYTIKQLNEAGMRNYFSGVHYRILFLSFGAVFFFGTNEFCKKMLNFKQIK